MNIARNNVMKFMLICGLLISCAGVTKTIKATDNTITPIPVVSTTAISGVPFIMRRDTPAVRRRIDTAALRKFNERMLRIDRFLNTYPEEHKNFVNLQSAYEELRSGINRQTRHDKDSVYFLLKSVRDSMTAGQRRTEAVYRAVKEGKFYKDQVEKADKITNLQFYIAFGLYVTFQIISTIIIYIRTGKKRYTA